MQSATDEISIKLHTDVNGHVWYASGIGPAHNSAQISDVFLLSPVIAGMGLRLRVLGVLQNAELIAALYLRRRKNEVASLEIAGPNICESPEELADAELVLHRMRSTQLAGACGGWRVIGDSDYIVYAMIARMLRNKDAFDAPVQAYLLGHPAYHALTLIPTLSAAHTARLFKTIVDPRWFVDRRSPDRQGKLDLFMGLTPRIQKRVSDSTQIIHRPRELRCGLVLECWKNSHAGAVSLEDPRNFLYRIHHAAGGGFHGDLRASQAFLRYLRYNWLDAIERRRGVRDGLFAPELFFKTPAERKIYEEHMTKA